MKNYIEVYFNLTGDVYAKYTVSAATRSEADETAPVFVTIGTDDPKLKELYDDGVLCYPLHDIPIYDDEKSSKRAPSYYTNGMLTAEGVMRTVGRVADMLSEVAGDVWEKIDPRCSAKVPSRLYRNTAAVCADVLTHLGIPATVKMLPLLRENHNGLCNQYRVTVSVKVPQYPWKKLPVQNSEQPNKKWYRTERVYETLNFDFDVTNQLRVEWVWPGEDHFDGYDARILRDGKPVKWVGRLHGVVADTPTSVIMRTSGALPGDWKGKLSTFLEQTSMSTVVEAKPSEELPEDWKDKLSTFLGKPDVSAAVEAEASGITCMNL